MARKWPFQSGKWILGGFLLAISLVGVAHEVPNEANHTPALHKHAPHHYTVKKGDTLWDIANKYLKDPWRWKEIWHANPDIHHPDLIYPGDEIELSYVDGKPQLRAHRRHQHKPSPPSSHRTVVLHPRVRVLPPDRAIPTIPLNVIEPFFNQSQVVTREQAKKCPRILALDEDHLVVGQGDHIYVQGLSVNNRDTIFSIFRPTKSYHDPKTKAFLGIEGLVLGKAQIEEPGNPARLVITDSYAEIKIGDRLMETPQEKINPYFVPRYPNGEAVGKIISVFGGINQISQYQVLVVTGGRDRKREVGDVLAIYQNQKDLPSRLLHDGRKPVQFPPIKIGRCVVFRVFEKVSYVLVMNASRPIYLLDEVWRP